MNELSIIEITSLPAIQVYLHPEYAVKMAEVEKTVRSTVHEPDEAGMAESKKFAATIRSALKSAKTLRIEGKKTADADKLTWEKAAIASEKGIEDALTENEKQFEALIDKKLDEITDTLQALLEKSLDEKGVLPRFRENLSVSHLAKLNGSFTPKGDLTKRCVDGVNAIVASCFEEQTQYKLREQTFKAMCLEAEISPPLDIAVIGSMVDASEDVFLYQCQESIALELNRKAELENRMREKLERENQEKIAAALKAQQDEANRIAQDAAKADQERLKQERLDEERQRLADIAQSGQAVDFKPQGDMKLVAEADARTIEIQPKSDYEAQYYNDPLSSPKSVKESAPALSARSAPEQPTGQTPAVGKRSVSFSLQFSTEIGTQFTDEQVIAYLESHVATKVLDELNKLRSKFVFYGVSVND